MIIIHGSQGAGLAILELESSYRDWESDFALKTTSLHKVHYRTNSGRGKILLRRRAPVFGLMAGYLG